MDRVRVEQHARVGNDCGLMRFFAVGAAARRARRRIIVLWTSEIGARCCSNEADGGNDGEQFLAGHE